ncbi:FAD-dependent monooxygenase [Glutamicibacter endophyticus]|uniref:FAD-dependent monooxygenase n=1 Tax=Glutamicibacter endophyticus TaxID=1522174 RepID=UPI003AF12D35
MSRLNKLSTDVLVVGAGPSGLALAAELRVQGLSVIIIDRAEKAMKESRALGLTIGALEHLLSRGQIEKFGDLRGRDAVHFAGFPLSTEGITSDLSPAIEIPQYRTEEVLNKWLEELGGSVTRGWELIEFSQDEDHVISVLSDGGQDPIEVTSKFIVGCDGAKSAVRAKAGLDFKVSTPSVQMLLGDFLETDLPDNPFGKRTDRGMVMSGPIGNGAVRVIVAEFGAPLLERGKNLSGEEITAAYKRVLGEEFTWGSLHWGSSFTDASGMAEQLVKGRVALIGDAAHVHLPAGGQGMNVSILDAANLGWRLALATQTDSLFPLQDFEEERQQVAKELITNTQAQGQLFLRGAEVDSLRKVIADFLKEPYSARNLARSVSSLDSYRAFEYSPNDEAIGRRALSGVFPGIPNEIKRSGLQKGGQWVFVTTREPDHEQKLTLEQFGISEFSTSSISCETEKDQVNRNAVLLRPDGVIAWTDESEITLDAAFTYWTNRNNH